MQWIKMGEQSPNYERYILARLKNKQILFVFIHDQYTYEVLHDGYEVQLIEKEKITHWSYLDIDDNYVLE